MISITCDMCGSRIPLPKRCRLTVQTPMGSTGRTVEDVLEEKDSRFRKEVFDLCGECSAQLALSIKASKLRISRGEKPV